MRIPIRKAGRKTESEKVLRVNKGSFLIKF